MEIVGSEKEDKEYEMLEAISNIGKRTRAYILNNFQNSNLEEMIDQNINIEEHFEYNIVDLNKVKKFEMKLKCHPPIWWKSRYSEIGKGYLALQDGIKLWRS